MYNQLSYLIDILQALILGAKLGAGSIALWRCLRL